jgi:glycosyltransferase involved in cell wall biosynthesis
MLGGLARADDTSVAYWGPPGPLPGAVEYLCSQRDRLFLQQLADQGGIAHLLRSNPLLGLSRGFGLTRRMRLVLEQNQHTRDVFHLNWLQSALAIPGAGKRALVTVLGTDYKLLEIPGLAALLRRRFAGNHVVLAPNAQWMVPRLEALFGKTVERVQYVPLGIDNQFYTIDSRPEQATRCWITVLRLTRAKMGPLLEWTEKLAGDGNEFHLMGPMQEEISLPPWIHYHGPVAPDTLIRDWYPRATAMITLSQHDEGRPQVLLEAMASGVPVIASGIPAHTDLLGSTGGGLMANTYAEFTAAIEALSDRDTRASLSVAARQSIKHTYGNWDDCADRYLALYNHLLREAAM